MHHSLAPSLGRPRPRSPAPCRRRGPGVGCRRSSRRNDAMRLLSTAALVAGRCSARAPPSAAERREPRPTSSSSCRTTTPSRRSAPTAGSLVETPHIDRIAREGVLFRNAFVTNSICAPSRAVFLTGKYSHLNGLRDNRDEFDGSQVTFPKLLQQGGLPDRDRGQVAPEDRAHRLRPLEDPDRPGRVLQPGLPRQRRGGPPRRLRHRPDHRLRPRVPRGSRPDPPLPAGVQPQGARTGTGCPRSGTSTCTRTGTSRFPRPSGTTTRVARRRRARTCASPTCTCPWT